MEGYIVTNSGGILPAFSPERSPMKPTFVGKSPEGELTNIITPKDRPFRVSIEGNIGAGKSTLIKYFSHFPGIETHPEPIEWWRNLNGYNLLDLLYTDINKWHITFQMYVQLTRLKIQSAPVKSKQTTVQIFERSIQNNRFCFVEQAFETGYLHNADYVIIDEWYKWAKENYNLDLDLIVYLKSTPEVVYNRMKERGRPEESIVSLDYLKQLHDSHENWLINESSLNTIPVLVLDADKTLEEITEQYRLNKEQILGINKAIKRPTDDNNLDKAKKVLKL